MGLLLDASLFWDQPESLLTLAIGYSLLMLVAFGWALRNYLALPLLHRPDPASEPDCMVVIPARNEAGNIGKAVSSLPQDTVIVVDDGSTDGTAKEAEKAGAGVIPAPKPPRGGLGKSNACMAGAASLKSKWILFADADTWYEPGFLAAAVAEAERAGVSYLSIQLRDAPQGLVAHLVAPFASAIYHAGVPPTTYARGFLHGQCLLARRESYEFVGGHAAVMQFLAEDIRLGAIALRHRMLVAGARAGRLGHARSHPGWSGMWEGLTRNAFRYTHMGLLSGTLAVFTMLLASLWLPLAILLLLSGQSSGVALVVLTAWIVLTPWYRNFLASLLSPFAIYVALPPLIHAAIGAVTGSGVTWKGRRI